MQVVIPAAVAIPIRRNAGATVTIVNQSATDVYFDGNPARLNRTVAGAVPDGTKIAAAGGQIQWPAYPGVLWFRAAADTTLEVQP